MRRASVCVPGRWAVLAAGLASLHVAARADEAPAASETKAVLHLANGGYVAGSLVESDQAGQIRWEGTAFARPLHFFSTHVRAIHMPAAPAPVAQGDTCLELAGGDVLFGRLVRLDERSATLDVPRIGPLVIARDRLRMLTRLSEPSGVVFVGPAGLAGWHAPELAGGWRDEGGPLASHIDGAVLRSEFHLPDRAVVEFELSWTHKPDFVLALGVGNTPASFDRAFHFEVTDDELVVQCETETEADVSPLGTVAVGGDAGRAAFRAYLDQPAGRIAVASSTGTIRAELALKEKRGPALPGIVLLNKRGESGLRLERLRVLRWSGDMPQSGDASDAGIRRSDGTFLAAQVSGFDEPSGQFVARHKGGEVRVAAAQVASVSFPAPRDESERTWSVVTRDGARLSGELVGVGKDDLSLAVPGVEGPLRIPLGNVRAMQVTRQLASAVAREKRRRGTLEAEGTRLPGHLAEGTDDDGSSCLVWQPDGSANASPLRSDVSGRIVYRTKPATAPTRRMATQPANMPGVVVLRAAPAAPVARRPAPVPELTTRLALHLVSGDIIPGEVTAIDDKGVSFRSANAQATMVPHSLVKAVELARLEGVPIRLPKIKRERLLTLPRMQKESPPTHLIQSRNGDYLRARVVKMDDATLQVEVHLEAKDIPRNRVARIIWLHAQPPATEDGAPPRAEAPRPRGIRVQAVQRDGARLTFLAERAADDILSGTSEVLGPCQTSINELDELLIGGTIESAASQLAYQRWKLQDAPEPKYVQADGSNTTGMESDLVGKPAPDFTLDLLGGKAFHLADTKGKVVVLDFWATWCGPCLQAMPQVERAAKEFADQGVQLVAVNLEETPKAIQALLDRQKLELTVALDREGAVAAKYKAHAIPQTVVIDREGNVARLFVGSSPHLEEQLRDAIRGVLGAERAGEKKE